MTAEQRLTTRQEWAAYSDEVQADINTTLGGLVDEIELVNTILKDKFDNEPDAVGVYVQDVLEYFDDLWAYKGDEFTVVGEWYEPVIAYNESGLVIDQVRASAFHRALSNGFMVKPLIDEETGDERPVLGLSFKLEQKRVCVPAVQGSFELLAFAELRDISLQYRRPGTTDVISSDLDEIRDALTKADSLLYLHTNHKASSFYRQSGHKQQEFLRRIIDTVTDVLPLPETGDELVLHDAKTHILFAKEAGRTDTVVLTADEKQKCKFRITGEILGVMIPDALSDEADMQYSHPDEFTASGSGLGLIVNILESNLPPLELKEPTFVVPLRAIKKIRMSLQ